MTSLALSPSNHGYGRTEHPVSGILLNRTDDGRPVSPFRPRGGSDDRGLSAPDLKVNLVTPEGEEQPAAIPPAHPTIVLPPAIPHRSHSPQPMSATSAGVTAPGVHSPRIRFAPLPEPRPRSLSTGRNVDFTPGEGPEGERIYSVGLQNMEYDDTFYTTDENDESDDESDDDSDASIDWGKWMTLGMYRDKKKSRKGRPSSFTSNHSDRDDHDSHDGYQGQPLKKSVSTGGFIGSSPFRFTPEIERKKQMTGSSAGAMFMGRRGSTDNRDNQHRRGSASVDMKPVRMINGRVYGARRASEAAADEAARRRRMEPAFVEWGSSQKGYGSSTKGGDDDDGGGMAWVKRRREERERKAREAKEAEERAAAAAANGDAPPAAGEVGPMGERLTSESLPPSLVQGGHGSMSSASSNASDGQPALSPTTPMERPSDLPRIVSGSSAPQPGHVEMLNKPDAINHTAAHDGDRHVMYAVNVPNRKGSEASYQSNISNATGSSRDGDDDEDDEYADDDDEEDVPIDDRCTRAAGVEVMAKHHKNQG